MSILNTQVSFTGLSGVIPNLIFIETNDTLATIAAPGYLTHAVHSGLLTGISNSDMALVTSLTANVVSTSWLQVQIAGVSPNQIFSLISPTNAGGAIFEGNVQAGSNGTPGAFISYPAGLNSGFLQVAATNSAGGFTTSITNAALGQNTLFILPDPGAAVATVLVNRSAGTQTIATGNLALSLGTLTLGSAGHASSLTLFPATAANGTFIVSPVNAGGAFNTTLSNSVMGQTSVISIPDPGNAIGHLLIGATATPFTANHLLVASGAAGVVGDAGFQIKSVAGAAVAGGAAAQTVNDAFVTAGSNVVATWNTQTNAASILKVVPGAGSFVVTSSADPGASTLNYIVTKV